MNIINNSLALDGLVDLCDRIPPRVKRNQSHNLMHIINALGYPKPEKLLSILLRDRRGNKLERFESGLQRSVEGRHRNSIPYYAIDPDVSEPIMLDGRTAEKYTGKAKAYIYQKINKGGGKAVFVIPDPKSYETKEVTLFSTYSYPL